MLRAGYLLVGAVCYAAFFVSFVYLVGFLAGLPLLPTHVDKGIISPAGEAVAVNLLLIAVFGLQHSIMARQGFKAWWTSIVPVGAERSVYCLASALALALLFYFWHPINAVVWNVASPSARILIWGFFLLGIGGVFISTWLLNHFELFGLAQSWHAMRQTKAPAQKFRTPLFYRISRHPLYTGFIIAFWATPHMTVGHALLSAGLTLYILIGIHYEERDLVATFGETYDIYRTEVSMLVPLPRGK